MRCTVADDCACNALRMRNRYGEVRLPHLLYGWEVVDVVGWDQERLTADANWRRSYEPTFVLRAPAARDEL